MEGTGCSQIAATSPTLYSTCSCACCCEGGSAAHTGEMTHHQQRTHSSSSSPPSCACRCTCSCACGRSGMQPDEEDQEDQLKQVNSVFSAAEAALQAFWRASIARVEMNAESAGSEAAYSQVKTAARSQAAASIAWVLAAASVVLKEDTEDDEDDDAGAHFQYPSSAAPHYPYPEFHPLHRRNAAPNNTHNIIRRPYVQLSRSSMHGSAGSSYYKSNMHSNPSIPRWEWRPIRNSNNSTYSSNSCMSNPPCAPSPSPPPTACSSMISACTAAPAPDHHPCGIPSITISSLLPPLINCRISNTPYNQETLTNSTSNPKTSNPTTHNPSQSTDEINPSHPVKQLINIDDSLAIHGSCTKASSTLENENVAIDIVDTQLVSKTLVEPFHVDKETSEEQLNIDKNIDDEEEEKEKTILDLTQDSPTLVWGDQDNTFSFIRCPTSSCDSKPSQQDFELSSINTRGKNQKKHLKKKQRKATTCHL